MRLHILLFTFLSLALLSNKCDEGESKANCVAKSIEDCICTMDYNPVCGCDGVTYSNACMAECNSITEYSEGACEGDEEEEIDEKF